MAALALLLSPPLRIQLRNRRPDGEVPSKNCDVLVFFRNLVKIRGFLRRNSRFVHLLCLLFDVVKERPQERNPFLATNRAMTWNENSVLVPGGERLQSLPPAGHRALRVEADRVHAGEKKIARIDDV